MPSHQFSVRLDLTILAKNDHAILQQLTELATKWAQSGIEEGINGKGYRCEFTGHVTRSKPSVSGRTGQS